MLFYMAEYCDTPQSKERSNWEYKLCLNKRAILRLLDRTVTPKWAQKQQQRIKSTLLRGSIRHGSTSVKRCLLSAYASETFLG